MCADWEPRLYYEGAARNTFTLLYWEQGSGVIYPTNSAQVYYWKLGKPLFVNDWDMIDFINCNVLPPLDLSHYCVLHDPMCFPI